MNEICCSDEVAEAAFFLGFKKKQQELFVWWIKSQNKTFL